MTIQPIGTSSMALFLTPDDLKARGLTPENLSQEHTMELTRAAFAEAGIMLSGHLEIDAYPDPCGVLVFARIRPPAWHVFSFSNLEEVITAAHALPSSITDASLTYFQGSYHLALPGEEEQVANMLSEFGSYRVCPDLLIAHVREHGQVIFAKNALQLLRTHFSVPFLLTDML